MGRSPSGCVRDAVARRAARAGPGGAPGGGVAVARGRCGGVAPRRWPVGDGAPDGRDPQPDQPGLRQARSALVDASIAASDTPLRRVADVDAIADAGRPSRRRRSRASTTRTRASSTTPRTARDETQLGEPALADGFGRADVGDETQDPLSPSPKKRGSEETSDSPPPKRARASLRTRRRTWLAAQQLNFQFLIGHKSGLPSHLLPAQTGAKSPSVRPRRVGQVGVAEANGRRPASNCSQKSTRCPSRFGWPARSRPSQCAPARIERHVERARAHTPRLACRAEQPLSSRRDPARRRPRAHRPEPRREPVQGRGPRPPSTSSCAVALRWLLGKTGWGPARD